MVHDGMIILNRLKELSRRAKFLRAILCALRFFLLGLIFALPLLVLKALLPFPPGLLIGLAGVLALFGAFYGAFTSLSLLDVAKLADARLGLKERLATAVECLEEGRAGELVGALLRNAAFSVQTLSPQRVLPFSLRHEAQTLPLLMVLSVALIALPPLTFPLEGGRRMQKEGHPAAVEERQEQEVNKSIEAKNEGKKDSQQKNNFERRQEGQMSQAGSLDREAGEELDVSFQDTKLGQQQPDFSDLLRQADEPMKLLANSTSALDLGRSDVQTPHPLAPSRTGQGLHALKPGRPSGEELRQLIEELGRLGGREGLDEEAIGEPTALADERGRKASQHEVPPKLEEQGPYSQDPMEAFAHQGTLSRANVPGKSERGGDLARSSKRSGQKEARPQGERSGAMEETKGTMIGRRSLKYREKGPKTFGFTTGPHTTQEYIDSAHSGPGGTRSGALGEGGVPGEARKKGEAEGTFPGMGRSAATTGWQTPRLQGPKLETSLPGEVETYQTNIPGPGKKNPSRLSAQEVLSQYQRVMEEALSKEAIPFASRELVRDYFMSIERR